MLLLKTIKVNIEMLTHDGYLGLGFYHSLCMTGIHFCSHRLWLIVGFAMSIHERLMQLS